MKKMRLVWHSFTLAPDDSILDVLADCTCSTLVILRTSICRLDSAVEKKRNPVFWSRKNGQKQRQCLLVLMFKVKAAFHFFRNFPLVN